MARSNDYPRWRYLSMQAAMWLVFALSLAGAATATHLHNNPKFKLGQPITLQTISVRLPEKWKLVRDDPDELAAVEPLRSQLARSIHVIEIDPNSVGILSWFTPRVSKANRRRNEDQEKIRMGPVSGVLMIEVQRQRPSMDDLDEDAVAADERIEPVSIIASATLPSGRELIITLQSVQFDEQTDPQDIAVVKQVAASVRLLEDGPQLRRN